MTNVPTAVLVGLCIWAFLALFVGAGIYAQFDNSLLERRRRRAWTAAISRARWTVITRSANGAATVGDLLDRRYQYEPITPSDEIVVELRQTATGPRGKTRTLSVVTVGTVRADAEGFDEQVDALLAKAWRMQTSLATVVAA